MATKIKRGEEGVGKEGGTTLYSLRRLPQGGRTNREAGSGRRLRGRYVKRPRAVSMLRVAPGYGLYVSVWRRGSQWKRPRCVDRSCCKKSGITSLCDAVASRTVGWIGRRLPKVAGSIRLALLNLRHLLIAETSPEATMRMLRRALMVLNLDICRTSPPRRPTIAPRQSSRPICEDCPHRFCVGYRFEPSRKQSPPDQLDLSLVEGDLSTSPPSLARAAAWRGRAWWGVREPEAYIWRRARARHLCLRLAADSGCRHRRRRRAPGGANDCAALPSASRDSPCLCGVLWGRPAAFATPLRVGHHVAGPAAAGGVGGWGAACGTCGGDGRRGACRGGGGGSPPRPGRGGRRGGARGGGAGGGVGRGGRGGGDGGDGGGGTASNVSRWRGRGVGARVERLAARDGRNGPVAMPALLLPGHVLSPPRARRRGNPVQWYG